jgi:hypothetical protein
MAFMDARKYWGTDGGTTTNTDPVYPRGWLPRHWPPQMPAQSAPRRPRVSGVRVTRLAGGCVLFRLPRR